GNINLNMEEVDAKVLLDQSIGEFAERLKEKQIEVVVSSSEEKMMLLADNRYLWRVFDNIMSNIVKYAKADTRAYVDLKKEDDKLRFIFRNTSREQLNITPDELMERFVRGDKSRYTDGNGLGLSIASSLTKAMGGSMNLTIDGDFFKVILEFDVIDKNEG
ncbi:MAG: sensor histidine kinase, partial [Butyrivibrio sp.]|nr:sensor histidine kinase [Butyrivibrio sp.]